VHPARRHLACSRSPVCLPSAFHDQPPPKEPRGPVSLRIKFLRRQPRAIHRTLRLDLSRGGISSARAPLAVGTQLKFDFHASMAAPAASPARACRLDPRERSDARGRDARHGRSLRRLTAASQARPREDPRRESRRTDRRLAQPGPSAAWAVRDRARFRLRDPAAGARRRHRAGRRPPRQRSAHRGRSTRRRVRRPSAPSFGQPRSPRSATARSLELDCAHRRAPVPNGPPDTRERARSAAPARRPHNATPCSTRTPHLR